MEIDYWIGHSNSLIHQIFMIVMAGLQVLAFLFSVSYKAMNIYCYFILFPLSFFLFLRTKWKFLIFPVSLIFFLIPNFEELSFVYFDACVNFLNRMAAVFDSDYISMSVYICVLGPIILYLPFIIRNSGAKQLKYLGLGLGIILLMYLGLIYPFFKDLLIYAKDHLAL